MSSKRGTKRKKISAIEVNNILLKWCKGQKERGEKITYTKIYDEAKRLRGTNVWSTYKLTLERWLSKFLKDNKIHFSYEYQAKYLELNEDLFNWLLQNIPQKERIISETQTLLVTSFEHLNKTTIDLMRDNCNYDKLKTKELSWVKRFMKCHNILNEFNSLKNLIQKEDKANQSDNNLDKQLFNWLLEQKELKNTILLEMLVDKSLKLLSKSNELVETKKRTWPGRIVKRYIKGHSYEYYYKTSFEGEISPATSPNRAHKSDEIDQAGTSKSTENVTETDAAPEKVPSSPTKKSKTEEKIGISHEMLSNRAQKSDEISNLNIKDTLSISPTDIPDPEIEEIEQGTPPEFREDEINIEETLKAIEDEDIP